MRKVIAALAAVLLWGGTAPLGAQTSKWTGKAGAPATEGEEFVASGPIIVSRTVLEGWRFLYTFITEVEFVLCLEGEARGDTIVIDGFQLARMEEASLTSVRYHPCQSQRYVGTAHNHPPMEDGAALCYRSLPDRRSFEQDERAIVDIILCGPDRYIWILKDGTMGGPGRDQEKAGRRRR